MTPDLIQSDREVRLERAKRIKQAKDIRFPELRFWNYTGCARHPEPKVDCEFRACGGELFSHQRVGIAWLYLMKRGLLADSTGVGKTNQVLGLAAMLKERGELTGRMLIICQTPAVLQWLEEAHRWVPKLKVDAAYPGLTRAQRIERYVQDWDIMIVGYHMLLKDWKMLEQLEVQTLVIDDVDPVLNHDTLTHQRIMSLIQFTDRSVHVNATVIQTRLEQIHAATLPVGGWEVFGPLPAFERRYIRKEWVQKISPRGMVTKSHETVGYMNGRKLRRLLSPMVLRRTYEDIHDVRMPEIMPPQHVWLEMHPAQREKYEELRKGVIKIIREEGKTVKHVKALAKVGYGQQICAGLAALKEKDGPGTSVKLDWVMDKVTGEWEDRKVVVFIKNTGLLDALGARLDKAGVGNARIWGKEQSAIKRKADQDRFWKDPNCRVFMGTASLERSLNLQIANHVVNVDTWLNPARMTQILGRIRRAGSQHEHVWVYNLFIRNSQEEKYLSVLERRQAVADYVMEEQNQLYEALTAVELLDLIRP